MPKGLPVLKRRINSIKATKKVTKAMEMIATTRLKVWKDIMGQTRLYTEALLAVVRHHLVTKDTKELPLFSENDAPVSLHVVITSSLGLCGSYNYNIYQYIDKNIPLEDEIVIIGEKGLRHYRRSNRRIKTGHVQLGKMNETDIRHLSKFIIESFKEKQYRSVNVIYTRFINSLQAEPTSAPRQQRPNGLWSADRTKCHRSHRSAVAILFEQCVIRHIDRINGIRAIGQTYSDGESQR
jgi:F-type H+-transporting ATPase subunit gamma